MEKAKQQLSFNEAFDALRQMIGKSYYFRNNRIVINEVTEIDLNSRFYLMIDSLPSMKIEVSKVHLFISECQECNLPEIVEFDTKQEVELYKNPYELMSLSRTDLIELSMGLKEQFRKLKNSPNQTNIETSLAMKGMSDSMLALGKFELSVILASSKIKK